MKEVLVSVIIPSHNTEKEILKESVMSILRQTYHNLQIIIIDDGSIEPVVEELKDIIDNRMVILRNEVNMGLVFSLNRGLEYASGKYIARMDADDIAYPDRIYTQVEYLEKNLCIDIVSSFAKTFGEKEIVYKSVIDDAALKAELLWKNPFIHPTIMMRSEKIKGRHIRYSCYDKSEDFGLWSRLAFEENFHFAVIPEELLNYRIHKNQITQKKSKVLQKDEEKIINNNFDTLGIKLDAQERSTYFKFRRKENLDGLEKLKLLCVLIKINKKLPKNISKKTYCIRMCKEIFKYLRKN